MSSKSAVSAIGSMTDQLMAPELRFCEVRTTRLCSVSSSQSTIAKPDVDLVGGRGTNDAAHGVAAHRVAAGRHQRSVVLRVGRVRDLVPVGVELDMPAVVRDAGVLQRERDRAVGRRWPRRDGGTPRTAGTSPCHPEPYPPTRSPVADTLATAKSRAERVHRVGAVQERNDRRAVAERPHVEHFESNAGQPELDASVAGERARRAHRSPCSGRAPPGLRSSRRRRCRSSHRSSRRGTCRAARPSRRRQCRSRDPVRREPPGDPARRVTPNAIAHTMSRFMNGFLPDFAA